MSKAPKTKEEIEALPTILDVVEQISSYENQLVLPSVGQIPTSVFYDEGKYSYVSDKNNRNIVRLMPLSQSPFRFYRGQSYYYEHCIPSLYRANQLDEFSIEENIIANRIKTSEFILLLRSHPIYSYLCQNISGNPIALAQHYGFATEYLDITNSKWVAAFFASTAYDRETDTYYPVGREYGFGVMYISKDYNPSNLPESFFAKNGVIGYQYFDRPTKQSSFGFAMSEYEDFNDYEYFDKVFFRHDIDASKIVFDMSFQQRRFIPRDTLSKLARTIQNSKEVTKRAIKLCQQLFYPYEDIGFFEDKVKKKGWTIRESDIPIVEYPTEVLDREWKQWIDYGKSDIEARTLPVVPIIEINVPN